MTPEGMLKKYLREECAKRGWKCRVLFATHEKGWPDRAIFGPLGKVAWVEVKTVTAFLNTDTCKIQKKKIEEIRREGGEAWLAVGKEGIDIALHRIGQRFEEK